MRLKDHSSLSRSGWLRARHRRGMRLLVMALLALTMIPLNYGAMPTARADGSIGTDASVGVSDTASDVLTKVAVVDPRALARHSTSGQQSATPRTRVIPFLSPYRKPSGPVPAASAPVALGVTAADADTSPGVTTSVKHNFLGLASTDSLAVNGFDVEPPDQGLCVGPGGELETVNLAVAFYDRTGTLALGPVSLNAFFGETSGFNQTFISDPRCYYDSQAQAWFATIVAIDSLNASHFDVAVNTTTDPTNPWTIYRFNTTDASHPNCPCFGDQPLLGLDAHAVFVSTNEFNIGVIVGAPSSFNGAQVYAISKAQLLAGGATAHVSHFSGLMNGGGPAASLQPAITTDPSAPAEYFVDSLDFNATIDNRIGIWAMTNDAVLDIGGRPTFSGRVFQSELYGQPPNAVQRNSTFTLSANDDRMQQVQYVHGTLWAALDTVVLIPGDTETRAGAAWFTIVPVLDASSPPRIRGTSTISGQGYVAAKGEYLLFPAVTANSNGNAAMVMTISGSDLYPSAAYATGSGFSILKIVKHGSGPDTGFTCSFPYGPPCRWGDYSAATQDPINSHLWLATEYIGPPGDGPGGANWATRILEVVPQGG
jgi:hypothetical protein